MDFPHSCRKLKTLWIHVLCVGSMGTKHTHPSIVCLKPLFVFGHIELAAVLACLLWLHRHCCHWILVWYPGYSLMPNWLQFPLRKWLNCNRA